jgi:hypothetical protein
MEFVMECPEQLGPKFATLTTDGWLAGAKLRVLGHRFYQTNHVFIFMKAIFGARSPQG